MCCHRQKFNAQVENRLEEVILSGFLNRTPLTHDEQTAYAKEKSKSGCGQIRGRGDPTLIGFQPAKDPWDRSRLFLNPLARATKANETPCTATCMTAVTMKGEKTLTFFGIRITQASGLTCCKEEAFAQGDTARNPEDGNNYTLHFFDR